LFNNLHDVTYGNLSRLGRTYHERLVLRNPSFFSKKAIVVRSYLQRPLIGASASFEKTVLRDADLLEPLDPLITELS
jgi:hypothetical protein